MPSEAPHQRFRVLAIGALAVLTALWLVPTIVSFVTTIELGGLDRPYLVIFLFVVVDAVVPVFPSESLLTAASNLAAQDGSSVGLGRLIVAGAAGAIIGDSMLYWLARSVLRRNMETRVEQARRNPTVERTLHAIDSTAPSLIVFGRFVPGLRFLIGASMGLTRFPYRRFLLWSSAGGALWATYTCVFCFLVATVIHDAPVISIATSVVVTTAMLGFLYRPLKRSWQEAEGVGQVAPGDGALRRPS